MSLPRVLRILVVDDLVFENKDLREYIRNLVFVIAFNSEKKLEYVDVVFAGTPDAGAKLWQQEAFDLTLIDSHFIQKPETLSGDYAHDVLLVNATFQGLLLFKILKQLSEGKDERYFYRSGKDNFVIWSSLKISDIEEFPGIKEYTDAYYWPKAEGWAKFHKGIKDAVDRVAGNNNAEFLLERVITFSRLSHRGRAVECDRQPWPFDFAEWSFLIRDDFSNPIFPYLREVVACNEQNSWRLGRRLPDTARGKDVVCLPFVPALLDKPLPDLIKYLMSVIRAEENATLGSIIETVIIGLPKAGNTLISSTKPIYPEISDHAGQAKEEGGTGFNFLENVFPNRFFAAATPLTGTSVVGDQNAIAALEEKVRWLLDGRFGGVILKTTYLDTLDQWDGVRWPSIQVQSHMRSRCLFPDTGTATLWNTGRTALEMLLPKQLNSLLCLIKTNDLETHRVIISLGSKYYEPGELKRGYRETVRSEYRQLWEKLFSDVFEGLEKTNFPIVEINVRHFLREIVEYYLGGDEYLNPTKVEEKCPSDVDAFWTEYALWLEAVHSIAVEHKKMLILKMPHRSDTLALIRYALSLRRLHLRASSVPESDRKYGVRAISLVNALKTPVPRSSGYAKRHSVAWYADAYGWGDAGEKTGKYQMSGAMVAPYRNQLLSGLLRGQTLRDDDLEVMVSGGVTNPQEINAIDNIERSAKYSSTKFPIQIGTWALLKMSPAKWDDTASWGTQQAPSVAAFHLNLSDLRSTCVGTCHIGCQLPGLYEAFLQRGTDNKIVVTGVGDIPLSKASAAIRACSKGQLGIAGVPAKRKASDASCLKAITPRVVSLNERQCIACGRCQEIHYCDSFMDRFRMHFPPLLEPRNCTGCGLCVQSCPQGALQLFKPEHLLVLLDDRAERHEILNEIGVPHLCISNDEVRHFFMADERVFVANTTLIATAETPAEGSTGLGNILREIFNKRVGKDKEYGLDKFCLRREKEDLYSENRAAWLNPRGQFVGDALAGGLHAVWDNKILRMLYAKVAVAAMYVWTDPGQVLFLSPIVAVDTELRKDKTGRYQVINHLVVLRGGIVNVEGRFEIPARVVTTIPTKDAKTASGPIAITLPGPSFNLVQLEETEKQQYEASGYGEGRLDGLDFRGAGRFFVEGYNDLSPDERIAIAGLPWSDLRHFPGVADIVEEMTVREKLRDLK